MLTRAAKVSCSPLRAYQTSQFPHKDLTTSRTGVAIPHFERKIPCWSLAKRSSYKTIPSYISRERRILSGIDHRDHYRQLACKCTYLIQDIHRLTRALIISREIGLSSMEDRVSDLRRSKVQLSAFEDDFDIFLSVLLVFPPTSLSRNKHCNCT